MPAALQAKVTQFLTPEEKDAELRTTGSGYKANLLLLRSISLPATAIPMSRPEG